MKKVILTAAIVAAFALANTTPAIAQVSATIEQAQPTSAYEKVEVSKLPEAVTKAVAKDFAEATIQEAFADAEAKLYKLTIKVGEAVQTVVYNEAGEAQK